MMTVISLDATVGTSTRERRQRMGAPSELTQLRIQEDSISHAGAIFSIEILQAKFLR